jgi:hypothetical protein
MRNYHLSSQSVLANFPLQNLVFLEDLPIHGPDENVTDEQEEAIDVFALIKMIEDQNQDYRHRDIYGQSAWLSAVASEILVRYQDIDFKKWSSTKPAYMTENELAFKNEYEKSVCGIERGQDNSDKPIYANLWHEMLKTGFDYDTYIVDGFNKWPESAYDINLWPAWARPTIALMDKITKGHPARKNNMTLFSCFA